MDEKDLKIRNQIIEETFHDPRKIICEIPREDITLPEHVYPGEEIFKTENGEIIDLEFQIIDFDENELVKYVEFAEEMYEICKKPVSVYILCRNDIKVLVKECSFKSEAEFTIKLACISENPALSLLCHLKNKLKNGIMLDNDDLNALENLPMYCEKEDRNFFRKEYVRIINKIDY